jgi:glycosyltransferase involved in cell wall biosynthesis
MAEPRTAALFFHDEAFEVAGRKIVGRRVAGEAFLKAIALYEPDPLVRIYAINRKQIDAFQKLILGFSKGRAKRIAAVDYIKLGRTDKLAAAGALHRADPVLADFAWMRRRQGASAYSLTGITHTLCTVQTQSAIADHLVAPLQSWDAVICTSQAVRRAVEGVYEAQAQYLRERFGPAARPTPPQLPVIPLGIHTADFDTSTQEAQLRRMQIRRKHGIGAQDLCFLFLGRLTLYSKANPFPMLRALQLAAERTHRRLHLFQVGVFAGAESEAVHREAAARLAPDVQCHFLDGGDAEVRNGAWAAADVFTSLVDSIQETFGLTPLEAMAAGLPVVVSDWNGYRETVRDGVDGILVPTTMTPPGYGEELAIRHRFELTPYLKFSAEAALNVAVDLGAAVEAYVALIQNAGLRHRMGEAGRQRARETFEWQRVYGLYRELWGELAERRQAALANAPERPLLPDHPDPFESYSHYPTRSFGLATRVALNGGKFDAWEEAAREPLLNSVAKPLELKELKAIYGQLAAGGPATVRELSELFPAEQRGDAVRAVSWLLKADLVRLVDPKLVANRPPPLI